MQVLKGAYKKIKKGYESLVSAGCPTKDRQLGIQTIICKQNIREIPEMWIWARENSVFPYFEMITNQGRAKEHQELQVSYLQRHLYSCLVNSQGYAQPCTGVDKFVGNVREKNLRDILKESHEIQSLRSIYENIEGSCGDCEHSFNCYGCSGNAYQVTGNFLASDPTCWLNNGNKKTVSNI